VILVTCVCVCVCARACVCERERERALALLYIVESPFMVYLGDRLLIPSIKNNPKSWSCHNQRDYYCCGRWNFIFTAEL